MHHNLYKNSLNNIIISIGLGGGIFFVPICIIIWNLPIKQAVGISAAVIAAT